MWIVELLVVLFFIWLGARLGSIGIGFAGGFGVLVLALVFGIKPGSIPVDVILIIMSVIAAIAAMQVAGGLDFMVHLAEKVLRSNPKYITFIAPVVTYTMTMFAGTGLTAFSTLPVIAEVAKETGVRPSRPLAIATVASQIAITASPISAAVIFFASELEKWGQLCPVADDQYPQHLSGRHAGRRGHHFSGQGTQGRSGLPGSPGQRPGIDIHPEPGNVRSNPAPNVRPDISAGVDRCGCYATAISGNVGLIKDPVLPRDHAIMTIMLTVATLIALICRINTNDVLNAATFKSGMSACVCVLGVAWLGTTFVSAHIEEINVFAGSLLEAKPWLLAVVLFFAAMLLYSQAATTRALMPAALALGISPVAAIASFGAVGSLFVLPTYPTLLAAVEFDDTGSTRIGKYVFDHPFLIPGTIAIALSVVIGFMIAPMVL
jgi:anaerobic C4-dicarboxylate transporter DcuA